MKRVYTFMIAAALLCSMTACTRPDTGENTPLTTVPSGATLEVTMSHAFRWEKFLPEEGLDMCYFYPFGEQMLVYSPTLDG
ncbi:MAG: hypothetical protein II341_06325, partial [Oscillospiraceae bacterium]|nr:hypothetical protein [Oscillospiraceae bacterium]